jgi:hypothetical protein
MSNQTLANYERELAAFDALLKPDCDQRILFFCGKSGSGKTALLNTCLRKIRPAMSHIPIQFRGSVVSVAEIFYRAGRYLGWERLPHFTSRVADLEGLPNIQVDRNWLSGINNRISIALRVENPIDQEHRRVALTEAWFDDVKTFTDPLLMAFDTYEQATDEVALWIDGPFLARVAQAAPLRILLAGQKVPDAHNIEWGHCCAAHQLYGVPEAKYWLPVVEAMQRHIPFDDPLTWLAGVCHALKGHPKDIMAVIEGLPRREEREAC